MLPVWALQLLFVFGLLGGAAWYYTSTQTKIENLTLENSFLVEAAVQNKRTITTLITEAKRNREAYASLERKNDRAEIYQDQLLKTLHRHDLTTLTTEKPELIEKRINDATQKLFENLQSDSFE